jgi:anti-sigma B factor antagonist
MQVQEHDGAVVITVIEDQCGGLWKLAEPHLAAGRKRVVLDFSQVGFLNSVNIAAVISTRNKVTAAGGQVVVAEVKERVKAVFRVLKLERLFNLDATLAQALAG